MLEYAQIYSNILLLDGHEASRTDKRTGRTDRSPGLVNNPAWRAHLTMAFFTLLMILEIYLSSLMQTGLEKLTHDAPPRKFYINLVHLLLHILVRFNLRLHYHPQKLSTRFYLKQLTTSHILDVSWRNFKLIALLPRPFSITTSAASNLFAILWCISEQNILN